MGAAQIDRRNSWLPDSQWGGSRCLSRSISWSQLKTRLADETVCAAAACPLTAAQIWGR